MHSPGQLKRVVDIVNDRTSEAIEQLVCLNEIAIDLCDDFASPGRRKGGLLTPEIKVLAMAALGRGAQRELGRIHDTVVTEIADPIDGVRCHPCRGTGRNLFSAAGGSQ